MTPLLRRVGAGVGAGLVAGSLVGALEALWLLQSTTPSEYQALAYAAVTYGLIGGVVGLGLGVLLAPFVSIGLARRWMLIFAAVSTGMGGWFLRDGLDAQVYDEMGVPQAVLVGIVGALLVAALVTVWLGTNLLTKTPLRVVPTLRGTVVLWTGGIALACLFSAMPAPAATDRLAPRRAQADDLSRRPDVILVVIDSLRADVPVPVLDALARDGVRFDQAIAASSTRRTAMASLLTAMDPASHGCLRPIDALAPEARTVAEIFQEAGYATGGFPALPDLSGAWGLNQGFDWYPYAPSFPLVATESSASLRLYSMLRRGYEAATTPRRVEEYHPPAEAQLAAARTWLDANQGDRVFAMIHLAEPGEPWFHHPDDGTAVTRGAAVGEVRPRYGEEVAATDEQLSGFIAYLKASGRYEGSVIAITATQGVELGEHGALGGGGTLYEEQIHIPLVLKLPRSQHAGVTATWQVRQIDLAPSLLAAAGLNPDPTWQGQPLIDDAFEAHLADAERPWGDQPASRPALSEQDAGGYHLQSLRRDGLKVIEALRAPPENLRRQPPVQFYDLGADPGELRNLDGQGMTEEAALQAALEQLVADRARAALGHAEDERSAEERERLCAQGYLSGADCAR